MFWGYKCHAGSLDEGAGRRNRIGGTVRGRHRVREVSTAGLARYRVDEDLADDVPGVGPDPHDLDKRRDWQRVSADLTRAQRRLGREQTLERGRGLERD